MPAPVPRFPRPSAGFTLVEMVFVLVIGALIAVTATGIFAATGMRLTRVQMAVREEAAHETAARELGDLMQRSITTAFFATRADLEAGTPAAAGSVAMFVIPRGDGRFDSVILEYQAPADIAGIPEAEAASRAATGAGRIRRSALVSDAPAVWLDSVTVPDGQPLFDLFLGLPRASWQHRVARSAAGPFVPTNITRWSTVGSPLRMR